MNAEDNKTTVEPLAPGLAEALGRKISVRALLVMRGIKQTELAIRCGVGRAELNKVVNGVRKTTHIRQAIAKELGLTIEELWPRF
jgi:lambda repressor-like predicted transcriptional regulator